MVKNIASKAKQGVIWTAFFNGLQYLIQFGSSIALARILFPKDFGIMGLALIVIQFGRRFTDYGFTMVLVKQKELKKEHKDTVFLTNLGIMTTVALVIYLAAPYAARFFNSDVLAPVLMVLGLDFILKALSGVPLAILRRKMRFRQLETVGTISQFIDSLSSVGFAIAGFGVWSLVFGVLCGSLSKVFLAFIYSPYIPGFGFRKWALKDVYSFGVWYSFDNFLGYFIQNVDYFFIGKFLGTAQLGFYERAFNLMSMPKKKIARRINTVLFSTYSRLQDNKEQLIHAFLRMVSHISIIVYPLMIWMFFAAPSFITVLYGPKWTHSIYPLQVMSISGLIVTFTLTFTPLFMATDLLAHRVRRQFIYLTVLACSVITGMRWGINGVAWGVMFSITVQFILMLHLSIKKLNLKFGKFIFAQRPAMVYGGIQIGVLIIFQLLTRPYFSVDSLFMLGGISILSLISFTGSHFIFRFKEVDDNFKDILRELGKFLKKLPLIKRIKYISSKA